jgi:hypothetical protein
MSSPIVQPSAFSVSKVSITAPKVLQGGTGAKMSYLNYADSRALVMQTPSLPSPFGMNVFDKSGPPKYSIDLAMRGYQDQPKVKAFYEALTALDDYMIDQGVKNSKLWFKSDMKRDVVTAFYSPIVKFGRDKDGNQTPYPPNLKVQLRKARDSTEFECQFYDEKSRSDPHAQPLRGVPVEEMLVKKVEITALIQCTGVWFAGGKFGLSWKAVQMRLDKVPEGIHGYGFVEEDDGEGEQELSQEFRSRPQLVEDEDDETAVAAAPTATGSATAGAAHDDDEDEEDEEVAPAPVPKKTVVTKKKVVGGAKVAAK